MNTLNAHPIKTRLAGIVILLAAAMCLHAPAASAAQDAPATVAARDVVDGGFYLPFREMLAMAQQGNARMQAIVGLFYGDGQGVRKDFAEATRWFRLAAEQGDALAQSALGHAYLYGKGDVRQDIAEGMRLLRLAAEQGQIEAQKELGQLYFQGQGIRQDFAEAMRWVRLAAEQGDAEAQFAVGKLYGDGLYGNRRDYVEAIKWYRLAAQQGNQMAQQELEDAQQALERQSAFPVQ